MNSNAELKMLKKELEPGLRAVAQRIANAEQLFVSNVMEFASLSREDAYKVFREFVKRKAVKLDAVNGRYDLKHGAFWDKPVFTRAIEMATATKSL